MNKIKNILQNYHLYPYQWERLTDKTVKVFTGDQYVVLKQSKHKHIDHTFQEVYNIARKNQLTAIVPLYVSNQNSIVIKGKSHSYYVMPWVKEKVKEDFPPSYLPLFKEIANIHQKTIFIKKIEEATIEGWVDKQKDRVQKQFNRFERWISSFEAKHFISPAELLLLYLYGMIREVCKELEYWYGEWQTYILENKAIRLSLCHGQLSPSHFLDTEKGAMIINWEKAHIGEPVKDISLFFHYICKYSDVNREDILSNLKLYDEYFPLLKSEYASICIYLLHIDRFIGKVSEFVQNRRRYSETEWVRQFEQFNIYFQHALFIQKELKTELMEQDLES